MLLRGRLRRNFSVSYGSLDQKDLPNFVALQRLLLAVDVDHEGLQCHGRDGAGNDRTVPQLDGVVGKSTERDANASAWSFVRSHFQCRAGNCNSFLPQLQLMRSDAYVKLGRRKP